MTPEQIQKYAYRDGLSCGRCPYCAHLKYQHTRWRECRQDDPEKCYAVIHAKRRATCD